MRVFRQRPRQQFGRFSAGGQNLVFAGGRPAFVGNARPGEVNDMIGGLDSVRVDMSRFTSHWYVFTWETGFADRLSNET